MASTTKVLCTHCKKRPPVKGATRCVPCRQYFNQDGAKRRAEWKRIIYEHYGAKCKCCGETETTFLTIDHINNDGNIARRTDKTGGSNFYRVLARKIQDGEAPTDLQILCRNCNWGKNVNSGICPHIGRYIEP
jgi:hypothetical protein